MLILLQTLVNKLCINSTNKDDKRAITGDTLLALTAYLKRTAKRKPILIDIHAQPRLRSIRLDSNSPEDRFTLSDHRLLEMQPEKTAIELDEIQAYQELVAGTLTEKAHKLSIFSNPIPSAIEVKWKKLMPFAKDTQAILDAPHQYTTINIDRQLSLKDAKIRGKEVLKTLIHQITHADISYEIIHQCFWLIEGVPDDKWCKYHLTNDIPWDIKIEFSLWFLKQLERGQVDLWDKEVSKFVKKHLVTFLIEAMGNFQGISNIPLNLDLSAVLKELMTLTDDDLVNDAFSKLESLYQKQLLLIKSDSSIDSSLISLIDLQHTLLDSTINTKDADDVLDQLDSLTLDDSEIVTCFSEKVLCILEKISMLTLNQDQKERLNNYVRSQLSPLEFILDPHNIDYYECSLLFLYSRITWFIMPLMNLNSIALLKRITALAFENIEQLDIWLPNPHYLTEFLPLNTTQQKVLASKIYNWNDSNKDDFCYKYHELDHLYLLESNLVNANLNKKTRDQIIEQLHQFFRNKSYALSSNSEDINENNHFMVDFYNEVFSHFFNSNINSIEYFIKSLFKKEKNYRMLSNENKRLVDDYHSQNYPHLCYLFQNLSNASYIFSMLNDALTLISTTPKNQLDSLKEEHYRIAEDFSLNLDNLTYPRDYQPEELSNKIYEYVSLTSSDLMPLKKALINWLFEGMQSNPKKIAALYHNLFQRLSQESMHPDCQPTEEKLIEKCLSFFGEEHGHLLLSFILSNDEIKNFHLGCFWLKNLENESNEPLKKYLSLFSQKNSDFSTKALYSLAMICNHFQKNNNRTFYKKHLNLALHELQAVNKLDDDSDFENHKKITKKSNRSNHPTTKSVRNKCLPFDFCLFKKKSTPKDKPIDKNKMGLNGGFS